MTFKAIGIPTFVGG